MEIAPDTKDWTWVLRRPCPDCGLEAGAIPRERVAGLLADVTEAWVALLAEPRDLRRRPALSVW